MAVVVWHETGCAVVAELPDQEVEEVFVQVQFASQDEE